MLKFVKILVLFGAITTTACTSQAEREASEALRPLLVDPDSASYSFVTRNNDTICGFVNAKNRMGGFTGDQAFFVQDGEAPLILPLGVRAMEKNRQHCIGTEFSQQMIDRSVTNSETVTRELDNLVNELDDKEE